MQETNKNKEKPVFTRTYRDDVASILKKDNVSLAGAIIAEEAQKDNKALYFFSKITGIKKATKKNIFLVVISFLLMGAGVLSVYLVYFFKPTPIIKINDIELKMIIYSEYQREIFLDKPNKLGLTRLVQKEIANTNIPMGSLIQLYFTERQQENSDLLSKKLITTERLSLLIDARISDTFLRFIEPDFMFGFYSSSKNLPFLILKTRSFENSFPEILKWEKNIIEDLRAIFVEDNPAIPTAQLRETMFQFKDIVIQNIDARAVLDEKGEVIFVYAFSDKNTIVIATNKIALQEIFNRLTISYRTR